MQATLNTLTGRETIRLEELSQDPLSKIMDGMQTGDVTARTALALAYIVRVRSNPDLTWDEHLDDDVEVSFTALDDIEDTDEGKA